MPATSQAFEPTAAPRNAASSPRADRLGDPETRLGILVCERRGTPPFAESSYLRRLCLLGERIGIKPFAFDPASWNPGDGSVKAWNWDSRGNRWTTARRPLPAAAYDRAWPESGQERLRFRKALRTLREERRLVLLNGSLPHKAKVFETLARDRTFIPYLPPTAPYRGPGSLESWLRKHRLAAFLKPAAGSQGRRVLSVTRRKDGTTDLIGRDSANRPLRRSFDNGAEALRRLDRWIGSRRYLMQPLLDLRGPSGEPCDVRALCQKDRSGRWTVTGIAARIGSPASVTANLHGGGMAVSARETLALHFGKERGEKLYAQIRELSLSIADRLEQSFGRFAEFGLDYGIERNGKLWFLEANSKPGRAAMESVGTDASLAAAEKPLSYAKSILLRPPGRVIHEFDHL